MQKILSVFVCLVICNIASAQTSVPLDSLQKHIGENVQVCTRVYGMKSTDKVTFINMGAHYPNAPLTLVIFAKDLEIFKDLLPQLVTDKQVCVTGNLKEYKGKTEIILSKLSDINIMP